MNRALIAFSITICLILAASDARAFSSGPADYGAAFINGKLLIFGRLAQGLAWSGLQPAEQAQVFGYRCYDSRNSIWKTVGSRTMSGLRVMLLADMKCVKEQDYCADPNKAPEKAARASFPLYAACRPVLMNPSAFICEIDSKDVPALCELNSLSPERKIEQLFDGERFDLRIVFVGGKGGALRSPPLTYEQLFGATLVDTDADGIPDAWDNCAGAENTDQLDSNADGTGDACQGPAAGGGAVQ